MRKLGSGVAVVLLSLSVNTIIKGDLIFVADLEMVDGIVNSPGQNVRVAVVFICLNRCNVYNKV